MKPLQLFNFNGHDVRITDKDGQAWFVARDVCNALGIKWSGQKTTLKRLKSEWVTTLKFRTIKGEKDTVIVKEPGAYKLASRSNKPEAESFMDWVYEDVLPEIRKTGGYNPDAPLVSVPNEAQVRALEMYHRTMLAAKKGGAIGAAEYVRSVRTMLKGIGVVSVVETPTLEMLERIQHVLPLGAPQFDGVANA